jgi:nucleotide-binding universal stress UspA family protein
MTNINKIVLAVDNSDSTRLAAEAALTIAKAFDAGVVGIHGYNAFMHEGAFRIMEPTLPAEYRKEENLRKQRNVHGKLINIGMEKISLSYLRPIEEAFRTEGVSFGAKVREGKNFRVVEDMIKEESGDIVIIGASGFNHGCDGFIGSVCIRVLRNIDTNFLIVKKRLNPGNPKFVVCLDGSASAIKALRIAKLFAEKFNAELHLVYAFDSNLHKDIFERLKESAISREGFSFNSKEQERIHDEFIDKGLVRVGQMILDRAEAEVFETAGVQAAVGISSGITVANGFGLVGDPGSAPRVKKILEGHIYKKICDYASEINADMVFAGRTGRHFIEGMDIGSVAENTARFAPCNVFVAGSEEYRGWKL